MASSAEPAVVEKAPATKHLYLDDTDVLEGQARVVSVSGCDVVLDATLFYPGGGGQPCDVGTLTCADGTVLRVEKVAPSAANHSVVVHTVASQSPLLLSAGDTVTMKVDADTRMLHAKLHTGGHLLDCAMERIGRPMEPSKGMHFPVGTFVGYSGEIPADQRAATVARLNEEVARLIAEDSAVRVELVPPAEAAARMGVSELPPYLPKGQPVRFVSVASQPVGYPCAGTHLKHLGQLTRLTVTKIAKKGRETRVSYTVA